jgi:hypothetical protein
MQYVLLVVVEVAHLHKQAVAEVLGDILLDGLMLRMFAP